LFNLKTTVGSERSDKNLYAQSRIGGTCYPPQSTAVFRFNEPEHYCAIYI